VDLENLVEKITREVMSSMKDKPMSSGSSSPAYTSVQAPAPAAGSETAVLLCGSASVDPVVLKNAVSYLRKNSFKVTLAVAPGASPVSIDDLTVIRCGYTSDCSATLRGAGAAVILIPDIATASRLANLIADRFDIEAVLAALESGKQVWAINVMDTVSSKLSGKVQAFFKEIEGYGIKITKIDGIAPQSALKAAVASTTGSSNTVSASSCSLQNSGDCAGCGLCSQFISDSVKNVVNSGADRVSSAPGIKSVDRDIGKLIDHTLLKADATKEEVIKLCEEARKHIFASVCINPSFVALAAECLKGSPVKVCTVIGFPLGATTSMVKLMETRDAVAAGADEIDMVINVGALKAGDYDLVRRDIESVVGASQGRIVKVIIEAALLNDEEKVKACQISKQAGADFVKTSTGFGPGGATAHDVALMRQTVGKYMGVKASGGIRDYETAQKMVDAGATRIGASASVSIVKGEKDKGGGY
jgi:deoxyribose-phosphate aldolase